MALVAAFADGDEFHLRGDDPLARVPELGDGCDRRGRAAGRFLNSGFRTANADSSFAQEAASWASNER